jgi:hypothetical protein
MKLRYAGTLAAFLFAAVANAQTPVVNPTKVLFTASPDHNATDAVTGGSIVTGYTLHVVATNGNNALFFNQVLGKPTPDGTNTIGPIAIPGFLTLATGVRYTATVSADGPGGSAASAVSDPFGRPAVPAATGKPSVSQ